MPPHEPLLSSPNEKLLPAGRRPIWHHWYGALWGILGLLILVTYLGIYALHSQATFFRSLTSFVPTPFAWVDGRPLWIGAFDHDVRALTHFYAEQGSTQQTRVPTDSEIRKIAYDNLVHRSEANALAMQENVHVTQKDIDDAYQQIVQQAGSANDVQKNIITLWGWSVADYKHNVIEPFVLKQKLFAVLKNDPIIGHELGQSEDVQAFDSYLDRLSQGKVAVWYQVQ